MIEIDKVEAKGSYNDAGNVDDSVIVEAVIELHNDNTQNVVCSIVDRETKIRNDVLGEQLIFWKNGLKSQDMMIKMKVWLWKQK